MKRFRSRRQSVVAANRKFILISNQMLSGLFVVGSRLYSVRCAVNFKKFRQSARQSVGIVNTGHAAVKTLLTALQRDRVSCTDAVCWLSQCPL